MRGRLAGSRDKRAQFHGRLAGLAARRTRYVETHFHVLPAVDDGPSSVEESVELARSAAADGTRTIVATPHVSPYFPTDVSTIPDRVRQLQQVLERERIVIQLLGGAELSHEMVGRLAQRELETIAHGPVGYRWVLLEAPLSGVWSDFVDASRELRRRGFASVIAHPERSLATASRGWHVIERELQAGSALQLNAWSLAGVYGDATRAYARDLLQLTERVLIASDAHGGRRPPAMQLALTTLIDSGEADPVRYVRRNPRLLLSRGLASSPIELAA